MNEMTVEPVTRSLCPGCGTELAPSLLTCPNCHRLVHGDQLKQLAAAADQAEAEDDPTAALVAWRSALDLLPPSSRQHEIIRSKVADLGRQVDSAGLSKSAKPAVTATDQTKGWKGAGGAAGLGGVALLLWKLKFAIVLVATKAKFLLLGLTKASTFISMFLSIGVYWAVFGWQLAVGLVLSIYVHEMGHVAALMRYGVKASTPLFIPGLGAMIRLRQAFNDPRQDARVGLAGPLWGLGAAVFSAIVFVVTSKPIWAAIAQLGAWINLFNLLPFWQLDGGRAFRAFTRPQRWIAVIAIGLTWYAISTVAPSGQGAGMLILIGLVALFQTASGRPANEPDRGSLVLYIMLIVTLSIATLLPVSLNR